MPETAVAAGEHATLKNRVVVMVTVGVGRVVVEGVTSAQQRQAEEKSRGRSHWAVAKGGMRVGTMVLLRRGSTVVFVPRVTVMVVWIVLVGGSEVVKREMVVVIVLGED